MKGLTLEQVLDMGDTHAASSNVTPLRADAFQLNDAEKIELIERNFREIMLTLGLDLNDDSLSGTPKRVAKMFVEEIFSGLNPANEPRVALFENKYQYGQMLVEKNISVYSMCEHHFLPIVGKAHVAYISNGKVIGLSKLNRIVRHFSRRPQVQERLTMEIVNHLCRVLETEDVALIIDAKHFCVSMRGVEDTESSTLTCEFRGKFKEEGARRELLSYLNLELK